MAKAQGDPGRWIPKVFSASTYLSTEDIRGFGLLQIDTAGVGLRFPAPAADLGDQGWEGKVVNTTTGLAFMLLKGGFNGGRDCVVIPPGRQVHYEYYRHPSTGYQCDVDFVTGEVAASYSAALAWTTGTPTLASVAVDTALVAWQLEQGVCFIEADIVWDDGNGGTNVTCGIPLDAPCMKTDMDIPLTGWQIVDGVQSECWAYIDGSQAALEDRIIKLRAPTTYTNAKAGAIHLRGWYPVSGFSTFATDAVWGTIDPTGATDAMLYKLIEGVGGSISCFGIAQSSGADGNASSSCTFSLPVPPVDKNFYVEAVGIQLVNATYTNPYPLVDESTAAAASRLLGFENFQTHTDGNAHKESVAFFYEVSGWQSSPPVPDWSGGTADPTTVVNKGRFTVIGSQCVGAAYITATDGNGTTNLEFAPPVPPRYSTYIVPVNYMELSNAVMSVPFGYLDTTQTDPFDRVIKVTDFTTIANAQNGAVTVSWHYRIN
ncbi:MAG: hypothetical protein A2W19_02230 [Spirochaetes bacterium RBG_16_49_21]|nr:MAG: hypothetical protein A2W19_02230 [Spirochaetes bacterium RBG_16_49_21]